MSLTDEQIAAIGEEHGLCTRVEDAAYIADMLWFDGELFTFARAVESAATAPLLERIKELEEMNAQLREQNTAVDKACADLEAHIEQIERTGSLGSVDSWMALSDQQKREWFYVTLKRDTKQCRTIAELEQQLSHPCRHDLQAEGKHPSPCAKFCEAQAFKITIRGLERELEALRKDAGWRTIETAPENMSWPAVVFWVDEYGDPQRCLDYTEDGCWMDWHNHAEHVEIIGGHGVSYTPPYTHWNPLPTPPAMGEKHE